MRILHVINCFCRSGGAEKFVLDLALAQKKRGEDVTVLSLKEPAYDNLDFLQKASDESIKVKCLYKGNLLSPILFIKLIIFFRTHSFDVVNAHLFPSLYYCSILKSYITRLFFTEHSTFNRRRNKVFSYVDKYIYKRYDCTICISEEVQTKLLEHLGPVNTVLIPNGISLKEFSTAYPYDKRELVGRDDAKILLMVARFIESKDHLTLFNSLKYLPEDVHVVCVGTGPTETTRKKYCDESGLMHRVHFLGIRRDVSRIIKSSDIIVLSTAYEGFSIAMLEAMASGRPLIASRVPGVVDLIDGYTELFSYGDSVELSTIIRKLLSDRLFYNHVIAKNKEFALRYDIDLIAEKYSTVYTV